jgi:pseudaminic acid biosynthesis-associated methylase
MSRDKTLSPGTPQLEAWQGEFGDSYVNRNEAAAWKIPQGKEAFRRILGNLEVDSILEVGSNIGLNLIFINELFQGGKKLYAVEPNKKAVERLKSQEDVKLAGVWNCDAFNLPLADGEIDLVFTSGVLIHLAPDDLGRATDEIVRVARKYVLCIEYFSHQPVEAPYRGHQGLLFKRDFGGFYLDRYPQLRWIDYGFLWQREFRIFDNLNWWLFEKPR